MEVATIPTSTLPTSATLAERLHDVLGSAPAPLTFAELKKEVGKLYPKGTKKAPKPPKPSDDELLREVEAEVGANRVFVHPPLKGKAVRYAKTPPPAPPTPVEIVTGLVATTLASGDGPFTVAQLAKKPKSLDKTAFTETLERVIVDLKAKGQLHEHPGTGKAKLYAKYPPPPKPWHEIEPHKKPFASALTATKKVLALGGVTAEQILAALREALASTPKREDKPIVLPPPVVPPPVLTELRAVLKQAYEYLCGFVEFRDRLVELPRLYHETAKRMPGLTVEAFHRELWQMSTEWLIELQVENDPNSAKEPNLAIHRNDRLYYYARWK